MSHCDQRDLDSCENHFAIGVSILLLAFAVFGWGLHSKLSLYHVRARASASAPIAKLLSERERPPEIAQHSDLNHPDLHAAALAATAVLLPYPVQNVRKFERADAPPPPSRALALKGPSLRRPPPSLVA